MTIEPQNSLKSTTPLQLPSLNKFFNALQFDLVRTLMVKTYQDPIKASIQAGLECLFSHPEQVEWMFSDLFQKTAGAFDPPSSDRSPEELATAKKRLGSAIESILVCLVKKQKNPPAAHIEARTDLAAAYENQKKTASEGLDILYALLEKLNKESPLEPKFNSELAICVELLSNLIVNLTKQHGALLKAHLLTVQSKEAFENYFSCLYEGINNLMGTFLLIQNKHIQIKNNNALGLAFREIAENALKVTKNGEGKNEAIRLITEARAIFPKLLKKNYTEDSELDQHLSQINQGSEQLKKWAESKATTYFEQRNLLLSEIHELMTPLCQNYQIEKQGEDRPVASASFDRSIRLDSKSDKEKPRQASTTNAIKHTTSSRNTSGGSTSDSLQFLKDLISKEPAISPSTAPMASAQAPTTFALLSMKDADKAKLGREIADKAIDLLINDEYGRFNRAAAINLLNQFTRPAD
jgi:hypothetical protein